MPPQQRSRVLSREKNNYWVSEFQLWSTSSLVSGNDGVYCYSFSRHSFPNTQESPWPLRPPMWKHTENGEPVFGDRRWLQSRFFFSSRRRIDDGGSKDRHSRRPCREKFNTTFPFRYLILLCICTSPQGHFILLHNQILYPRNNLTCTCVIWVHVEGCRQICLRIHVPFQML